MLQSLGPCQRHVLGQLLGGAIGTLRDNVHDARHVWCNAPEALTLDVDGVLAPDQQLSLLMAPVLAEATDSEHW